MVEKQIFEVRKYNTTTVMEKVQVEDEVKDVRDKSDETQSQHPPLVAAKTSTVTDQDKVEEKVEEAQCSEGELDEEDISDKKPPAHEPLKQKPAPRPPDHPVLEHLSGPPSSKEAAPRASRYSNNEGKKVKRKKSKLEPGPKSTASSTATTTTQLAPLKHKGKLAILERVETKGHLNLEEEEIIPFEPPKLRRKKGTMTVTTSKAASSMGITLMNKREKGERKKASFASVAFKLASI